MRRGGERDMAFAGQQARGGVEADPAGAGKIDLGPGVQIGEIVLDLARPLERIDVGPAAGSDSPKRSARRTRDGAAPGPAATPSRGTIPRRDVSVSSGVWTPGSMRMM